LHGRNIRRAAQGFGDGHDRDAGLHRDVFQAHHAIRLKLNALHCNLKQPQAGFEFPKKIRPGKNSEIFDILQSHNQLTIRHLHKLDYLQLTVVGLRRSDWQFFRTSASCRAMAQRRRISLQPFL
jgi:hypothetical protein